jgi:hypothetical protein
MRICRDEGRAVTFDMVTRPVFFVNRDVVKILMTLKRFADRSDSNMACLPASLSAILSVSRAPRK